MKEKIMSYLEEKTPLFNHDSIEDFYSAQHISDLFKCRRNTASHYLNQLYNEGKLIKINTRPVYFLHLEIFEKDFFPLALREYNSVKELLLEQPVQKQNDLFQDLIGCKGSLNKVIEQIKTSIFYPGNGLPIMLCGSTGVGKSMLANLIYKYSVDKGVVAPNSPYIEFNCAQYYNNPELLSSNLFGYVKGAFTGAEKNKEGMLEAANGGILFLDEVHRLDREGQERLFTFMDQGVFRRMGESTGWHQAKVRLIFATTETLTGNFLETFLRRIPITVSIPDLNQRGIDDKNQFIYYFLTKEARTFNKTINISGRVIDTLLSYNFTGNIGELENTIKYICASAYTKELGSEQISIKPMNLPDKLLHHSIENSDCKLRKNESIIITPALSYKQLYSTGHNELNLIKHCLKQIIELYGDMNKKHKDKKIFEANVQQEIHVLFDKLIFTRKNENEGVLMQFILSNLQEILKYLETNYNIKFNGNSVYSIAYYLYCKGKNSCRLDPEINKKLDHVYQHILQNNKDEHKLVNRLVNLIQNKLDVEMTVDDEIILTFYLTTLKINSETNVVKGVILAHGYATASSIANVVNRMLGVNVFESFDMPIDITVDAIAESLIRYIDENDAKKGLAILFDTGSLKDIHKLIKNHINGPVALVNNVSTQMALYIGDMLLKGAYIEEIFEKVTKNSETQYTIIYPEVSKQKAIVTCCFTSMGTALQLQKLLINSIPGELDIKIIPHDFNRLKKNGANEGIFQLYDVMTIIGTANPEVKSINYISIEDLISGKGYNKLQEIFQDIADKETIQTINNNLVRNFSLRHVIDSLTILDTEKILGHLEEGINLLEVMMNTRLPNNKKISLYVHVSCMVERLIRQEAIKNYPNLKKFTQCQKEDIEKIKKAFSVIERTYNVEINTAEIGYIYDILKS